MKENGIAWELMASVLHPRNIDEFRALDLSEFGW